MNEQEAFELADDLRNLATLIQLNAVDLPELITETDEDYKNLAIELGLNPEKISKIKLKLENNKLNKPLFNTKLFTKNIELAYTEIYKKHVSNLPITNIEL